MSASVTLLRLLKRISSTFSKAAVLVSLEDLALVRVISPSCHVTPASAGVRNRPAAEELLHLAHQILPRF